ncbi:hypothetical protein DNTS_031741 [Danionella cerebrum]|uniref:PHD-type domain-containing protein n=1 Tax=Danionella cerebrum TaxID=2873325 RepID=A0A553QBB1_9TELE|nr:hypothetical protein DNTS_031741 [Danionella translucida]
MLMDIISKAFRSLTLSLTQKKVVEQLRKELLVKQEPELKTQTADCKTVLLSPACISTQPPTGPPLNQGAPQKTLTVTPVITAKTLPLVLKAATSTMPASMATQRPTVTMVTAINNPPRPATNSDAQSSPINLQVASKLPNQDADAGVRIMSKNVIVVQATTTSAQPIKVPQFVPPPRLTPRPTLQPQVRAKPTTPINVPIAPAPPPPMVAAPLIQRPLMLTTKLTSSLPASSGPIHQVRIVNGQQFATFDTNTTAVTSGTTQVTGIVISPAQTLQISNLNSDLKTVKPQGGLEQLASKTLASTPPPLSPSPPVKVKREESPQKLAFMVSLGLVTYDHLEEIQSRRQERKRRTTANPVYSGAVFEPERKKSAVTYLNTPLHQGTRKRGRPPKYSTTTSTISSTAVPELGCKPLLSPTSSLPASPALERPDTGGFPPSVHPHSVPQPSPSSGDGDVHEDFCTVCRRSGQLLMCDTCSRVYHLDCLEPPLKNIPKGMWICPKCQDQILKKEEAIPWPGSLAIVHSYIAYKEAKEEEKQRLSKYNTELMLEREQLDQSVKQLSNSITPMETEMVQDSKPDYTESVSIKSSQETTPVCVQESTIEPSVQIPAAVAVPDVKVEPEVGEMAEPAAAVTPEAVSGISALNVPKVAAGEDSMDTAKSVEPKELPQVRDVKTNGGTDCVCTDINREEEGANDDADSENIPPINSSCAEDAGKMEVELPESGSLGMNNNNGKTSEPSQQGLQAPLSAVDNPK